MLPVVKLPQNPLIKSRDLVLYQLVSLYFPGSLKDGTGSYVACYQYLGTCSFLATVLLMCEPLVRRFAGYLASKKQAKNVEI